MPHALHAAQHASLLRVAQGSAAQLWLFLAHSSYDSPAESFSYCQQAIENATEANDELTIARGLRLRSWIYHRQNEHINAIDDIEFALRVFRSLGHSHEMVIAMCDLARAHFESWLGQKTELHHIDAARMYIKDGLSLADPTLDKGETGRLYHTWGRICAELGEFSEAIDHYNMALSFFDYDRSSGGYSAIMRRMAAVYRKQGRYDEAMLILTSMLADMRIWQIQIGLLLTLCELGNLYFEMGPEYIQPCAYALVAAKQIVDETEDSHPEASVDCMLARLRDKIGDVEYDRLVDSYKANDFFQFVRESAARRTTSPQHE